MWLFKYNLYQASLALTRTASRSIRRRFRSRRRRPTSRRRSTSASRPSSSSWRRSRRTCLPEASSASATRRERRRRRRWRRRTTSSRRSSSCRTGWERGWRHPRNKVWKESKIKFEWIWNRILPLFRKILQAFTRFNYSEVQTFGKSNSQNSQLLKGFHLIFVWRNFSYSKNIARMVTLRARGPGSWPPLLGNTVVGNNWDPDNLELFGVCSLRAKKIFNIKLSWAAVGKWARWILICCEHLL